MTGVLEGRLALIAGASSGIGRHLAGVFARAGAEVVLAARRLDRVEKEASLLRDQGLRATGIEMDVADAASVDAALKTIAVQSGRSPDLLLNCAGVILARPFLEQTAEDVDRILNINLRGAFFLAQRVARDMCAAQGGAIIHVASTAGLHPGGQLSSYCASKAGLVHLTKVMALELARHKIRVNVLCPGNIETDMHQEFVDAGFAESLRKRIPQRRFGQVDDLDGAALLLASDAGRYMTGAVLTVDGGQLVNSL